MDEAGYGPNLGPLLVASTRWDVPGHPAEFDLYGALQGLVTMDRAVPGQTIQIADSKQVYSSSGGLASLESSALTLLALAGCSAPTFQELLPHLDPVHGKQTLQAPWYTQALLHLPVSADSHQIERMHQQLRDRLGQKQVSLGRIVVAQIEPDRFNRLLETLPNKAELLTRTAFSLLRSLWNPADTIPTLFIGDKHGGRSRYDHLLSEYLDGEMIFRLEEQREISRYKVGHTELRFQQGGERHLPVAASSIIAKYLRELSMILFNQFWLQRLPHLKPTKGYPEDARRFRQDMEAEAKSLGFDESLWWRSR